MDDVKLQKPHEHSAVQDQPGQQGTDHAGYSQEEQDHFRPQQGSLLQRFLFSLYRLVFKGEGEIRLFENKSLKICYN
jgi:hypothetical protein